MSTSYGPGVAFPADTVIVTLPEPEIVVALSFAPCPEPIVSTVSATTPLKPSIATTAIVVEHPGCPVDTERKDGSAKISKSGPFTSTRTNVSRARMPPTLVPVISTV